MRAVGGLIACVALMGAAPAVAGPWTQPKGQAQVILKAERMSAEDGLDPDGQRLPLPAERTDDVVSVFAEYGLTPRVTLQLKAEHQSGEDAFVDYEGRGPVEIGLTWQAWRDEKHAVSLYAGFADGGEGRNAGYAPPGVGEHDVEIRLSVGRAVVADARSKTGRLAWLRPDSVFIDGQIARRARDGLPDETRLDLTSGSRYGRWMLLNQAFGGQADGGARWLNLETSLVRDLGDWSLQAGWRRTVLGRETPVSSGPVIALWKRF